VYLSTPEREKKLNQRYTSKKEGVFTEEIRQEGFWTGQAPKTPAQLKNKDRVSS